MPIRRSLQRLRRVVHALHDLPPELSQLRGQLADTALQVASLRDSLLQTQDKIADTLLQTKNRITDAPLQTQDRLADIPVRINIGLETLGYVDGVFLFVHTTQDIISECIRRFFSWELEETDFFLKNIKPGHTVLDLGSNIGYYTCIGGKIVGPQGKVFSFEPNDANFLLLSRNILLNKLENVTLMKVIVSDRPGVGILHENVAGNQGAHMAIPIVHHEFQHSSVHPIITLDSLNELDIGDVHFIKMDTQGSEPLIFKGGSKIIGNNRRHLTMVVEFSPTWIDTILNIRPIDFIRELRSYGFEISFINQLTKLIEPLSDAQWLIDVLTAADGITWVKNASFADLLLMPAA